MTTLAHVRRSQIASSRFTRDERAVYALDRMIAIPLCLAAAPVVCAAAIVTAAISRRPPFVAHHRIGRYGRPFWMLKLRTMWGKDAPGPERTWLVERIRTQPSEPKAKDDPNIGGRFSRFCRKYSIDELPQLWHVATGQMSMIGPRPITQPELETHYGPSAGEVLSVRPGLSGLWQVMGRSRLSYRQRLRLDLFLVRRLSPGLYLGTLLRTVPRAMFGRDAW